MLVLSSSEILVYPFFNNGRILFALISIVDALCKSDETDGVINPPMPSRISAVLNAIINP